MYNLLEICSPFMP